MLNGEALDEDATSGKRPVGVWILTLHLALFAGIVPLLLLAYLVADERSTHTGSMPSGAGLLVPVLIGVGVVVSAIAAWRGKNWGRYALVAFAALHYGLVAANNFVMLQGDTFPDVASLQPARLWGRVIRGPIYVVFIAWYFLVSERARGFYRHADRSVQPRGTAGASRPDS